MTFWSFLESGLKSDRAIRTYTLLTAIVVLWLVSKKIGEDFVFIKHAFAPNIQYGRWITFAFLIILFFIFVEVFFRRMSSDEKRHSEYTKYAIIIWLFYSLFSLIFWLISNNKELVPILGYKFALLILLLPISITIVLEWYDRGLIVPRNKLRPEPISHTVFIAQISVSLIVAIILTISALKISHNDVLPIILLDLIFTLLVFLIYVLYKRRQYV